MEVLIYFSLLISVISATVNLRSVHEWKYIDYKWPSPELKAAAIKSGEYNYTKPIPIDVDVANDGRIFITLVRSEGVPATLVTISNEMGPNGPLMAPYPNWSWNKVGDCSKITGVYRIFIDKCDRLWVMDNGYVDDTRICPPQLLAFDLANDELLERIVIPDDKAANKAGVGMMLTPVVLTEVPHCAKTTVFMTDVTGFGLIIWDDKKLTRLENPVFNAVKTNTSYTIDGTTFVMEDGVTGMVVSRGNTPRDPTVMIFRPMSSVGLYMTSVSKLLTKTSGQDLVIDGSNNILPSQVPALAISEKGTVFFGLMSEMAIGCWNRYTSLVKSNIEMPLSDKTRLQFASGLRVKQAFPTGPEDLWIVTNRFQKFMTGTMNFSEINFRLMKTRVEDLISGTKCERPYKSKD